MTDTVQLQPSAFTQLVRDQNFAFLNNYEHKRKNEINSKNTIVYYCKRLRVLGVPTLCIQCREWGPLVNVALTHEIGE